MFFGTYQQLAKQQPAGHMSPTPAPALQAGSGRVSLPESAHWPVVLDGDITQWLTPDTVSNPLDSWQLTLGTLDGQHSKTYTYKDLLTLPQTFQVRRVVDASGWTYRCEWEGVLLRHLVNQFKPSEGLSWVLQRNAIGQEQWIPLEALLQQNSLLALRQQGQLLSPWHGGPIRLLVFDRYWHVGLGQLAELRFAASPEKPSPTVATETAIEQTAEHSAIASAEASPVSFLNTETPTLTAQAHDTPAEEQENQAAEPSSSQKALTQEMPAQEGIPEASTEHQPQELSADIATPRVEEAPEQSAHEVPSAPSSEQEAPGVPEEAEPSLHEPPDPAFLGEAPIEPGRYYAFDLKSYRTIERAGEANHF